MADIIERTIYKLELDDSGYINGVNRTVASTTRLSEAQERANQRLQQNQETLRNIGSNLISARAELEKFTGADTAAKAILQRNVDRLTTAQADQTKRVNDSKIAYDNATKAAQNFVQAQQEGARGVLPSPQNFPIGGPRIGGGFTPQVSPILPNPNDEFAALAQQLKNVTSEDITNALGAASEEMDAFREVVASAEAELANYDETQKEFSEEFKNLSLVVSEGTKIINEFDKQTAQAAGSAGSYRTQITNLNKDLQVLQQANKEETEEYKNKQKELIKVTRAYQDQRQQVRILASETRVLDFGKAAITTATQAFQAYTSVSILAGGASEELQKKTFQLFAAMQLITSLEQLNNNLKRVSVLRTNAQSVAQTVFTAAVGASTGALRAFRIAMLATVGGAVIVGLGVLISKYIEFREAQKEAREEQELYNSVNEEAIRNYTAQVVHLELIKDKLTDLTIPEKERVKLAKEYNKTAEEGNKIDTTQISNIGLIISAMDKQIAKIKERTKARAAENVIVKLQEDVFLKEEKARLASENKINQEITQGTLDVGERALVADIDEKGNVSQRFVTGAETIASRTADLISNDPAVKKAREKLEKAFKNLGGFIKIEDLISPDFGKDAKIIENVFEQEKRRLIDTLTKIRIDEAVGVKRINDEFVQKFRLEQRRIADLLKEGKILPEQATILIDLAAQVNKEELDKALADFGKVMTDAQEKINKDLENIRQQNAQDEINLIQGEFERKKAAIDFNEETQTQAIRDNFDDRIESLNEQLRLQLILEKDHSVAVLALIQERNDAIQNIETKAAQDRVQLAIESFKQIIENFDSVVTDSKLINDKAALEEVQALVATFQSGAISYEDYKKKLAAIQKKYEDQQLQTTITTLEKEIRELTRKRNNIIGLTGEQYDELTKIIKQKEAELVAAQGKQATGSANAPDADPRVGRIERYAQAIGELTESVIQFWVQANAAESAALDRSIAIQERRVNEAIRIAERGNASYLKMEEDRLKQLQIAKENAARREIAINAAVQASQILVGVTGAISRIATTPFGAETIADIAIIVAALASGYAIVRSLQNNQPRFAGGTKYVQRTKEPSGTDTIPAWLTEGEAVITKDKNRDYAPAIAAIHDGTIPPEHLNKMVERYYNYDRTNNTQRFEKFHEQKSVPQIHYEKIKNTTEMKVTSDGKLAVLISDQNKKIDENNELQRRTLLAMKNMSVSATIDKNGVAIAVNEYIEKMEIDKKI